MLIRPVRAGGCGGTAWTFTGYANAQGNGYIEVNTDMAKNKKSDFIYITNWGFAVPSGKIIKGIQVKVSGYGTIPGGGSNNNNSIQIIVGGTASGTANTTANAFPTADDDSYHTYGNATDLWGLTLSSAQINATDFGVAIQVKSGSTNASAGNYRWFIDHVTMEIWYDDPGTIYSRTGSSSSWSATDSWSTTALDGASCTCTPTSTDSVVLGHTKVFDAATATVASLNITAAGTLDWNANNKVLTIASTGGLTIDGVLTSTTTNKDIVMNGYYLQGGGTYSNAKSIKLEQNCNVISGSSIAFTAAGKLDLNGFSLTNYGTITIGNNSNFGNSGTFVNESSGTLFYMKDANMPGITLTATAVGNTVRFAATLTANRNIPATTYYNLIIAAGGSFDYQLAGATTVNGTLTMTTGDIIMGNNNLILDNSATISGGSASSYLQLTGTGVIQKYLNSTGTTYTFPMGDDATDYSPCTFLLNSGTLSSAYIQIGLTDGLHAAKGAATDYISRYWSFTPSGISGTISYDATFTYVDADVVGTESNMVPGKYSAGAWTSPSGSVNTGTNTISMTAVSSFSDFISMDPTSSPLPVKLTNFEAKNLSNSVLLEWATSAEVNCSHYEIEKSANGIEYTNIGFENGAGSSNVLRYYYFTDITPKNDGISYYRLKQVDYNGASTYYGPVTVYSSNVSDEINLFVAPNPAIDNASIFLTGLEDSKEYNIYITDVTGRNVKEYTLTAGNDGSASIAIMASELNGKGIYFVSGLPNKAPYKLLLR